jgi:uncharacterized membrane protein (UPF0127 family)
MAALMAAWLVVATVAAVQAARAEDGAARLLSFDRAPLEIVTSTGRHAFTVELALNDGQRSQGLMFRRYMAPDAGMLFVYPRDRVISMWMKNTFIPLDMVFVAADGRVVALHERAVPHSLRAIGSGVAARGVIEFAAGTIARLGIRVGDRVSNDRLGSGR